MGKAQVGRPRNLWKVGDTRPAPWDMAWEFEFPKKFPLAKRNSLLPMFDCRKAPPKWKFQGR